MVNRVQTSNLGEKASHSLLVLLSNFNGTRPAQHSNKKNCVKLKGQQTADNVAFAM